MSRYLLIAAAASLTALAGCAATDDGSMGATAAMAGDMTPSTRNAYVTMAAASDLYEIQSSQLAQSKAQRADVRQFAAMLIEHHTNTTAQLMAASQASGFNPPPPTLTPDKAAMIEQLRDASGADFDRAYLGQQVPAHEQALALHRNYASNGDTPALRTTATAAVPIIQGHLTQARQLAGK